MKSLVYIFVILVFWLQTTEAQKITRGEYFFDVDPGIGNATPLSSFTNFSDSTLNLSIATSSLSSGAHVLYIRFCDVNNVWGHTEGKRFNVFPTFANIPPAQKIKRGEYFIDTDPGAGNAAPVPSFTNFNDSTIHLSINATSLSTGEHALYVRFCSVDNVWGQAERRRFNVFNGFAGISPSVTAGEYFIDKDLGVGSMSVHPSFTPFTDATLNISLPTGSLTAGTHTVFTRYKGANGIWGHYEGRTFTVCAIVPISQFSVANTCRGNSVTIVNSSSNAVVYQWDVNNDAIADYTTAGNVSHLYATAGIYTINLKTTSSSGCTNVATSTVEVYPIPTVAVNSGSLCSGNSFTIVPSGAGVYTITGDNFLVSPPSTTQYSITGTSTAGCLSANTAISTVTVFSSPTVVVNSGSICSGNSFTIVPSGANDYSITGNSFTVSPLSLTQYSITGTSTAGCLSNSPAVSTVTVFTTLTVAVNSGSICSGNFFTINPTGAFSYSISGNTYTVSPETTTQYTVVGTSSAGCISDGVVSTVSVYITPTLAVSGGSICSGNSFTIDPTGASTYSVTGDNFTVSPSSTTQYSITGISTDGCVSTSAVVITVTVIPSQTLSVNSGSICAGDSFTIVPTGLGNFSVTGNNFIVSPSITTSYSVTSSATSGCAPVTPAVCTVTVFETPTITVNSGSICTGNSFAILPSGANSYSITGDNFTVSPVSTTSYSVSGSSTAGCVSANPAVAFVGVHPSPTLSVNSGSVCSGQTFTLMPTGADTYTFQGGSSIVSPLINTSYTVIGTNSVGCVSESFVISDVTVYASPTLTVNSGSLCSGQSFTIVPSGADTYTIEGGSFTVSPTSNTTYTIIGASIQGCVSESFAISNLTVHPLPVANVGSSSTICLGNTTSIGAVHQQGSSYNWISAPAGFISNIADPVVSPTTTTSYFVIETITTTGCSASNSVMVTVNPVPIVNAGLNNTVYFGYAPEQCTILSGSVVGGIIPYQYLWTTGVITASISVCPTVNTVYTLTATDANGCSATDEVSVTVIDVHCNDNNKITICHNPGPNEVVICVNYHAVNNLLSKGDYLGACGQVQGRLSSQVITSVANNKSSVDDKTVLFSIYPNPTSDKITFTYSLDEKVQTAKIIITNLIGEELRNYVLQSNTSSFETDVSNLAYGMYLYRLIVDGKLAGHGSLILMK